MRAEKDKKMSFCLKKSSRRVNLRALEANELSRDVKINFMLKWTVQTRFINFST